MNNNSLRMFHFLTLPEFYLLTENICQPASTFMFLLFFQVALKKFFLIEV